MAGERQIVYVAPRAGRAHWREPIGALLVSACRASPMQAWGQELPGDVPVERRCRHRGCAGLWRRFDERVVARANGPPISANSPVTYH